MGGMGYEELAKKGKCVRIVLVQFGPGVIICMNWLLSSNVCKHALLLVQSKCGIGFVG